MEHYFRHPEPSPRTDGNLYAPLPGNAAVHGGWRRSWLRGRSGGALALLLAGGVAIAGIAAARRSVPDRSDRRRVPS